MKKLLLVLAIGAFVACNESATEDSTTTDTATSTLDPNTTAPAVSDTAIVPATDSSAVKVDSAAAK